MISPDKLLISKIDDMLISVKNGREIAFSNFLSEDEVVFVTSYLKNKSDSYTFFGGYEDAQRKVLCIFDKDLYYEPYFPITPIAFLLKKDFELTHRDVLGSLMSTGVKREFVGDIIFTDTHCVFFTIDKMSEYFLNNFTMVKRLNVEPFIYQGVVEYKHSYIECYFTLSSMRVDCLVSSLANVSRTVAEQLILSGFVNVNGVECSKKDKCIELYDIISIRKKGKFKISELNGFSKKGKIKLKVLKYN